MFIESWRKHQQKLPLQPLERLIAGVIREHPEYQQLIEAPEQALDQDFLPDAGQTNPFLHMGLHLGIREQVSTDRPAGIAGVYRSLAAKSGGDAHAAEHIMIECLAETLWEAQGSGRAPDEQKYIERLRHLAGQSL